MTSLDTEIFIDDRVTPGSFNLASLYTENVLFADTYPIKYRVYHTVYNTNIVTLVDPFTITIIDPCDKPASLTASSLVNQEYTITDAA